MNESTGTSIARVVSGAISGRWAVRLGVAGAVVAAGLLVSVAIPWGSESGLPDASRELGTLADASAAVDEPEARPVQPRGCRTVEPGDGLGAAIEEVESGGSICLKPGVYTGSFTIERPVTIVGPREAVVRNPGEHSTFYISADAVRLAGFTIEGSGTRYTKQDAGIFVSESEDVRLEGLKLQEVLFGITSQKVDGLHIVDTVIECRDQRALGMRGDGIRLWETRTSRVEGNRLEKCRDMVVWYSPDNVFLDNEVRGGRYGIHFMYSSRNLVRGNHFVGNVVGIFVMYSRNIIIDGNVLADASGAAGVGLGLKESGNLEVTGNRFLHNTVGTYLDTSPLHREDRILFALNEYRLGGTAVTFHSTPRRVRFEANNFSDNLKTVQVEGGGHAREAEWVGNYWDVYAGYDMGEDGVGDVPFEYRPVTDRLVGKYPTLEVLNGTLAMFLVEASARVSPLYTPDLVMKDTAPRMQPVERSDVEDRLEQVRAEHGIMKVETEEGRAVVRGRENRRGGTSRSY